MKFLTLILLLCSFSTFATDFHAHHRKGFIIKPTSAQSPLKAGEVATFSGEICVAKFKDHGATSCHEIEDEDFMVRAYFPDESSEVTEAVSFTRTDSKIFYHYNSSALVPLSANTFTLMITPKESKIAKLYSLRAKIEQRLIHFEKVITKYQLKDEKEIADYFIKFKETLLSIIGKINIAINSNPDLLARLSIPIQVDNERSAPLKYSSLIGGYQMSFDVTPGLPFEGESIKVKAEILNLTRGTYWFPKVKDFKTDDFEDVLKYNYEVEYRYNNVKLLTTDSFKEEFVLKADDADFEIALYKIVPDNKKSRRYHLGSIVQRLRYSPDSTPPIWLDSSVPNINHRYVKTLPEVKLLVTDPFGRIDPASVSYDLIGGEINLSLKNYGDIYALLGGTNLAEGSYTLSAIAKDFAGNSASYSQNFDIDTTAPQIITTQTGNRLTNNPIFNLPLTIIDNSPTSTQILHNGAEIFRSEESLIDLDIELVEGENSITINALDRAGNLKAVTLSNITLDTTPPTISDLVPVGGQTLFNLFVLFKGKLSESLSTFTINNEAVVPSALSFEKSLTFVHEGDQVAHFSLSDLAGNITSFDLSFAVVLKVLNKDLVAISPHATDPSKLIISGAPYASRPGITVNFSAGLFNKESVVSNSDGSFVIEMDFFNSVTITATDTEINKTDSFSLTYNVDTTLSGVVKDHQEVPLPGVVVSIASSSQSAVTDATGTFKIANPTTGDQTLIFDGTQIPLSITGPNKKYSKVAISVSLGTRQTNVLDRPIYLVPLLFDGSETIISNTTSPFTVSSPHAQSVSLEIKSGSATFPDGKKTGVINMMEISSNVTSIGPLEFAVPETVIALEPSGTTFSTPIKLTLPNVNELPAGVQVVIMSKNSQKGIWEIDGLGVVTSDGQSIETIEGGGLTHFSEVYAVPIGPTVKQIGSQDQPGSDLMNGSVTASIDLPSYIVNGHSMAPNLKYNSSWAKPTTVVTNLFDVPRNEFYFQSSGGARGLFGRASVDVSGKAWIEPDFIDAIFYSENLVSNKMRFTGVPNKSVISYAMDLSGRDSGAYVYNSHYDIHLKQLIVGTRTTSEKKLFGKTRVQQESFEETRKIEQVFPSDLGGPLLVQNYQDSNIGRGWRLNGVSKLFSVNSPKVMYEDGDGNVRSYSVNNTIETIFQGGNKTMSIANFEQYPDILFYTLNTKEIYKYNIEVSSNFLKMTSFPNLTGELQGLSAYGYYEPDGGGIHKLAACFISSSSIEVNSRISSFVISRDTFIGSTDMGLVLTNAGANQTAPNNILSGVFNPLESFYGTAVYNHDATQMHDYHCRTWLGLSCGPAHIVSEGYDLGWYGSMMSDYWEKIGITPCLSLGYTPSSTGTIPQKGFRDGPSPMYNSMLSIIKGKSDNVLIADNGNNRVRSLDLTTKIASTIAGNGQTNDSGNGGMATSASMFHPRGLAYDALGNLYVSTERGYIRRIDPTGRIHAFAGKRAENGGIFSNKAHAEEMVFNNPYGMVSDFKNNYLYVADTGHHRIVRIDLVTKDAVVVAGNGTCATNPGDGLPAIEASICSPEHIGLDDNGNLLLLDKGHNRIRRVNFENSTSGLLAYKSGVKDQSTLTRLTNGEYERKTRSGTIEYFDESGFLYKVRDQVGQEVNFFYNERGDLLSMTDPVGNVTSYNYSSGKLQNITDPTGRKTIFQYDGNDLVKVVYPNGMAKEFDYTSDGLLTNEYDERGNMTSYFYNQWNRLTKIIRADESVINLSDYKSGTIANNFSTTNVGRLKNLTGDQLYDGIKDAKGNETKFNSNEDGFITKITDAKGQVTEIERDLDGRPTKITRPDTTYTSFVYSSTTGDLLEKFDSSSNLKEEFSYDSFGNLLTKKDFRGVVLSNNYHATTGQLLSSTNVLGQTSSQTYLPNGLVANKTDSLNRVTSFIYDPDGNLVKSVFPDGKAVEVIRDDAGNVTSKTDAGGRTTFYEFDTMNRLTKVTTPKGEETSYMYDQVGSLSKITDPYGNITTFEYDVLNRLTKKTDPLGRVTTLGYDNNGNLVHEIDPMGRSKIYQYDNLDQLIKRVLPDNIYEMSYDVRGNLVSTKNNETRIDFEYDLVNGNAVVAAARTSGLNAHADLPQTTLEYFYDELGNRIQMSTPNGNFAYTYDIGSRLTGIRNASSENFAFNYDQGNRITKITRPGTTTDFAFDSTDFLTSIIHKKGTNIISKAIYTKDLSGNRTSKETLFGLESYNYDLNSQLTSVISDSPESFIYDKIGNRTEDQLGQYIYDSKRQILTEDYKNIYTYDPLGNLSTIQSKINSEVKNFTYNSENRLIKLALYEGVALKKEITYLYDSLGRRVEKEVTNHDNSTTDTKRFVYDGNEILFELNGNNDLLATYTHSTMRTDDLLSIDNGTRSFFIIKDGLGSTTEITDELGDIVENYAYTSFGVPKDFNNSISKNRFTYTGREYEEESGLYYYIARFYSPEVGRFISVDPHPGLLHSPTTHNNKYIYVLNSPTNYTDPNGKIAPIVFAIIVGAIIGGVQAHNSGDSILSGIAIGAISGAILGGGMIAGGALIGGAAGQIIGGALAGGIFNSVGFGGSFTEGAAAGALGAILSSSFEAFFAASTPTPAGEGSDVTPKPSSTPQAPPANSHIPILKMEPPQMGPAFRAAPVFY